MAEDESKPVTSWSRAAGISERIGLRNGLDALSKGDFQRALIHFRTLDQRTAKTDREANLYTSYHGFVLVCLGDRSGLNLCRHAADKETKRGDVFHNLALAELALNHRSRAFTAIENGLAREPGHGGLLELLAQLDSRRTPELPWVSRRHWLNKMFCRTLYRLTPAGKKLPPSESPFPGLVCPDDDTTGNKP